MQQTPRVKPGTLNRMVNTVRTLSIQMSTGLIFRAVTFSRLLDTLTVNPGENLIDFTVTPYIRIKDLSITHDAVANKINATFSLEGGAPTVKVSWVTLYAWTDIYVGEYVKKTLGNRYRPAYKDSDRSRADNRSGNSIYFVD